MKTFVIAQHHGTFLTLQSMVDSNIDDIIVIIPGSQVEKYNKMYRENPTNPEFSVFKDYDKRVSNFVKSLNKNIKVYVVDDFDVRNTICSTLKIIKDLQYKEAVACIMSGSIVIRDYREPARASLYQKQFGLCLTRVYQHHNQLSMYHMIGLPKVDNSMDLNFFIVDASKITSNQLTMNDAAILSDAMKRKQVTTLPREFNGKDDLLIGTAISARQTIAHNLKIQAGFIVNLWNKSIKNNSALKSEEIYAYPLNLYGNCIKKVSDNLPKSTISKIMINSNETEKCTSGLYECLDIIDL